MLPPDDLKFLADRAIPHAIATEANMLCIIFPDFALPPGFDRAKADLLLRLAPGYPDIPPDMWWFDPPVKRADGVVIPATNVIEQHLGRRWQRWSRHLNSGQWRSGVDSLEGFLALVQRELVHATPAAVQ
jgi:hypothetical protein